jgi:hypothetical protein
LQVSNELENEGLQEALQLAIEQYGNRITINGTNKFKEQVVRVAVSAKMSLSFTDPTLENWRQQLFIKENMLNWQRHRKQMDHQRHSF